MNEVFHMKVSQTLTYTYAIKASSQDAAFGMLEEAIEENDYELDFVDNKEQDIVHSDHGLLNYVREAGKPTIVMLGQEPIFRLAGERGDANV